MAVSFPSHLPGQANTDSFLQRPSQVIRDIPTGIIDLEADQEGNIYLLQPGKHKLYKYFKLRGYDSVLTIGGKGMGEEGFNFPSKITVPNRQNIFMLDQMNRRLVQLNTNLKILKDINFLTLESNLLSADVESFWPISFAVGTSGELYFLNQDDIRIYKFNTNGTLERSFGGLDYGSGSLAEPWDIVLNESNLVFAVDSSIQKVSIFDFYGTYQYSLSFNLEFRWKRLCAFDENLVYIGEHDLFIYNLFSKNCQTIHFERPDKIVDFVGGKDFIFILWGNEIDLYSLGSE
jgi:hypothetical protein